MRHLMWAVLAAGLMLAGSGASWANDTIRLGGPSAQADIQANSDTDLVHWRRGYGYYRPYYAGYSYRPYYASYYRPSYYQPYYRPYVYYSAPVYYQPYATYSCTPSYYYPIAGSTAPTIPLQTNYTEPPQSAAQVSRRTNGGFSYDGGPRAPIPMPSPNGEFTPAAQPQPRGIIPIDGKLVSLPTEASGGFAPVTTPEIERLRYVSTTKTTTPRIAYPAYGER